MHIREIIAFMCILTLLMLFGYGNVVNVTATNSSAPVYDPNIPPKTFEDLFFPHWFENGTYTFSVPEYMHRYDVALTNIWDKYYQYGAEKGRYAYINMTDNTGTVYWSFNNSNNVKGAPIGGPGRYHGAIKGNKIIIKIVGKSLIQLGIWGSWFENIIDGGTYTITFSGEKIALYMDYYNPTNKHTFYFKASEPVYAYLFGWDGKLLSYTSKPAKEGSVTEPYDASPFLTFVKPEGEKGNITVQFWMGYPPKHTDVGGVLIMLGIIGIIVAVAYVYSKRSIYGKGGKKR